MFLQVRLVTTWTAAHSDLSTGC